MVFYFNVKSHLYSLTPVVDPDVFVKIMVSSIFLAFSYILLIFQSKANPKRLNFSDIDQQIKECENHIDNLDINSNDLLLKVNDKISNVKFKTEKPIDEIRGCNEEIDDISMLNFVITEEFKIRPNWVFEEQLTKVGGTARFKAILNMNL